MDPNANPKTWWKRNWIAFALATIVTLFTVGYVFNHFSQANAEDALLPSGTVVEKIYWSDGDSGRANGIPFRLSNGDAPETGGVGAAIGGAKCEKEREWGFRAKEFMVLETKEAEAVIAKNYGQDRHGRWVVDISVDGHDLVELGIAKDVIRSWRHDGSKSLEPRPDWCSQE